jgi:beta-glucosidase
VSRTVEFSLGPAELRYWNEATRGYVLDITTFDVWVGGDSTSGLSASFSTLSEEPSDKG